MVRGLCVFPSLFMNDCQSFMNETDIIGKTYTTFHQIMVHHPSTNINDFPDQYH